jgi:exosome complex component RRP43
MLPRQHILADASSFEEPLLDTTVSIVLGDGAQPVSVSQLGAGFAKEDVLARCLDIAKVRYQEIYSQVYEV